MEILTRVFVISGTRLFAEALGRAIDQSESLILMGIEAHDSLRLAEIDGANLDLILVDTMDRTRRALELIQELGEHFPGVSLLPIGLPSSDAVVEFIEAGASGYAQRDASLPQILETVKLVGAGQAPCSPDIAARVFARITSLARRQTPKTEPPIEALSCREEEVLELLAEGLRNKEIANQLGIAVSTARNHVQRILGKLKANCRREAIRRAYEQGLLEFSAPWQSASA